MPMKPITIQHPPVVDNLRASLAKGRAVNCDPWGGIVTGPMRRDFDFLSVEVKLDEVCRRGVTSMRQVITVAPICLS